MKAFKLIIEILIFKREYEKTIQTNSFHRRIDFKSSKTQANVTEEAFVFHSNSIMMHFTQANELDEFGNLNVHIFLSNRKS